ncbi:hypothetical protein EC991_006373 [Linnemannia zychae]|nr:hypothetical protein EC991_006373 [Linnemannia zychae]
MSASSNHIRKRDKFLGLFRSSGADRKSKSQSGSAKDVEQVWTASTDSTQLHRLSTVSTNVSITGTVTESTASSVKIEHVVANMAVKDPAISVEPSPMQAKPRLDVFKQNINPPSVQVSLPEIRTRIDTTPQLALCMGLLNKDNGTTHQQNDNLEDLQSDTTTQHTWILAVKQDPIEQDHIRWLGVRMVDEFAKDASKDSTEIAEIVLLGPEWRN